MLHIVDCRPYDSLGDVPGYSECVLGWIPVTPFENKVFFADLELLLSDISSKDLN